jgi:hypothetical protein
MIDHPPVDCRGMLSQDIAACLMDLCQEDGLRDMMVRITLKNVNRAAYRGLDQGRINRLGSSALYFKIRPEFEDEEEHLGRPVDRCTLQEEFSLYLDQESGGGRISAAIRSDVRAYGSEVMERAVSVRRREPIDAS